MTAALASATVPEKRHNLTERIMRVRGLERAGELIGKAVLADLMRMPDRTLRAYMAVDRQLPNHALVAAADALEARCAEITAHVAKLRALADGAE